MITQRLRQRLPRRLFSGLALLGLLWASVAPTLLHAMAASGQDGWVQVCTAQGLQWVAVDTEHASPDGDTQHALPLEHCPACLTAAQPWALPPQAGAPMPALSGRVGPPPRFAQAPRTAHAWLCAQPRAPPRAAVRG